MKVGTQIDRFVIEQELGRGGMATVFKVRHASLGTHHALKILVPDLASNEDVRQRFLAEGRIQARLNHPNIVRVTDTVEVGQIAGLVMDFVEGVTLKGFLRTSKTPPPTDVIRQVFLQILAGVGHAHKAGIIHRDLKPENVLIEQRPNEPIIARVLDFGIAKVMDDEGPAKSMTRTGVLMGTPHYMSPEQILGARHVTLRSDIFSLGAVLYVMATRRMPFEGESEYAVMRSVEQGRFAPPDQVFPGIDRTLSRAITRALLPEAAQRFGSCEEFAAALGGASARAAPAPAPAGATRLDLPDDDEVTPVDSALAPEVAGSDNPKLEMEVEEEYDIEEVFREEVVVKPKTLFKAAVTKTVERREKAVRVRTVHKLADIPFARIEAGQFDMGSPDDEPGRSDDETMHEVIISRPFLMQTTPVTQALWAAVMGNNPSGFKGVSRPVEMVTWYDAIAFCNALSKKLGVVEAYIISMPQGRPGEEGYTAKVKWTGLGSAGFRLPTEAEWEYACRAGTEGPRYGELEEIAWWGGNSENQTNPVGTKRPNAWGLHDMIGQVWEWCWDAMAPYPPGPIGDPIGPAAGKERIWRGASWGSDFENCRAAGRTAKQPTHRPFSAGFRLARTIVDF